MAHARGWSVFRRYEKGADVRSVSLALYVDVTGIFRGMARQQWRVFGF